MQRLGAAFFRTAAGPTAAPKIFTGTTTTTGTAGAWSISYAAMGFSTAPVVAAAAISTGSTAATQAHANPLAPSTTSVSGNASVGVNAIVVGGATTAAAPAGTVIHVTAIGS